MPSDEAGPNVRPIAIENADATIAGATLAGPLAKLPGILGGFESYHNPKLRRLRDQYDPGAVMEGAADELDRILRLRHWVHTRWPIDDDSHFSYYDPFEILEWAKTPGRGFYCAHSQVVANAVFWACGFTTRMIHVDVDYARQPKGGHHAVNEVWSNQWCRWIAIDCKYDIHFERDGVPQSALELHEAVRRDGGQGLLMRWGPDRADAPADEKWHGNIGSYYWIGYWLRATHLAQPHWYLNNAFFTRLVVPDSPATRSTRWPRYHDNDNIIYEKDRDQINWTPNIPRLFSIKMAGPGRLRLRFISATPNFKEYRLRLDGRVWGPMESPHGYFEWPVHAGENVLDCRARNLWDLDGPVVTVRVEVK